MIRNFSPQELAYAKRLQGLPSAQYQQALYEHVARGGSLNDLLMMKSMLDQQEEQARAQQAVQMAAEVGSNPTPQSTVMQDMASRLQGVAALPTGEMFDERNYAGGGIVAFQEGGQPEEATSAIGDWLRSQQRRAETEYQRQQAYIAAQRKAAQNLISPFTPVTQTQRGVAEAGLAGALADIERLRAAPAAGIPTLGSTTPARPHTEELIGPKTSAEAAAAVPAAAPAPIVRRRTPEAPAKPAEDGELSAYDKRIKDLEAQRDKAQKSYEESIGERPEMLSPEQYQERRRTARERAEKEGGMKSYKERIDEIAAQATQAREDRDTDRWLALAQGFFAMGAGKSRYALQNMAEGLGVTTVQLKDAEKAYRQGEQARKDRVALLEEARRKEALGDVTGAMDDRSRAEQRNADYIRSQSTVRERLLQSTEARISQERTAKEAADTRRTIAREAAANRAQAAAQLAASKNPFEQYFFQKFTAAKTDEERDKVLNQYREVVLTKMPKQTLEESFAGLGVAPGRSGATLTKGPNGELIYTPGNK